MVRWTRSRRPAALAPPDAFLQQPDPGRSAGRPWRGTGPFRRRGRPGSRRVPAPWLRGCRSARPSGPDARRARETDNRPGGHPTPPGSVPASGRSGGMRSGRSHDGRPPRSCPGRRGLQRRACWRTDRGPSRWSSTSKLVPTEMPTRISAGNPWRRPDHPPSQPTGSRRGCVGATVRSRHWLPLLARCGSFQPGRTKWQV